MFDATESHFSTIQSADAQAHGNGLDEWQQCYEQLSCGPFEGLLEDLRLGPVQIFRESANRAVLQCGQPRPGTVSVGFLSQDAPPGWFCGHSVQGGQAIAALDAPEFELYTGAGSRLSAVSVELPVLVQRAAQLSEGEDAWRADLPSRSAVLEHTGVEHRTLAMHVQEALSLAATSPGWIQRRPVWRALADTMIDSMLDCLESRRLQTQVMAGAAARRRIFSRARDYMSAHAHEAVTVPQLCAAIGASRRSLQYAFEDALGISPTHYLRFMRLNQVHIDLLRGPAEDTVGDVAARWGFWHLPRFAAEYRTLFGELPSSTRKRRLV